VGLTGKREGASENDRKKKVGAWGQTQAGNRHQAMRSQKKKSHAWPTNSRKGKRLRGHEGTPWASKVVEKEKWGRGCEKIFQESAKGAFSTAASPPEEKI